uniref:Uncharacterized protein n=1 Tax=Anguilla anguilla TaxID=7936 RepID=A0A0E9XKZ8_ANGAN
MGHPAHIQTLLWFTFNCQHPQIRVATCPPPQ